MKAKDNELSTFIKSQKLDNSLPVLTKKLNRIDPKDIIDLKISKSTFYKTTKMVCFAFYKNIF